MIDKQDHLRPILTLQTEEKNPFLALLKKAVPFKDLLAFDLFVVPSEKARNVGMHQEMLASYRLDNLSSAHACLTAFSTAPLQETVHIALLCDAEEIGSRTAEGACSTFMHDILQRI